MGTRIRLQKDIKALLKDCPEGIQLVTELFDESNLKEIFIDVRVYGNSLYPETTAYRLRIRIPDMYPLEVPWVQFVDPKCGVLFDKRVHEDLAAKKLEVKQRRRASSSAGTDGSSGASSGRQISTGFRSLFSKSNKDEKSAAQTSAPASALPVVGEGTPTDQAIILDGIPVHPHVYGNGHICLSLLGDGWSPVNTLSSIAISLQSMLAGNTKYECPPDNNAYVMRAPLNPTKTSWDYHDDSV